MGGIGDIIWDAKKFLKEKKEKYVMKINWKQKLSSRKFWALLASLVVSVATAIGTQSGTIEHITGIIGALGACVVYMLAEAWTDTYRDDKESEAGD